ncbi:PREDICTED: cyclin-dependent kinase 2-interacting protein-like [Ceratosolen solmsi marchali]|uniref:Cyclin-dependent kinase 2-interacting protein-like n=1 Tax=Ceratosolen solmsi marchali TaxID=326594 RepID=A0AAJ6YF66_9HYME|nr:PREDICTED: cyclin-dependent kinase 2-interacting protein-like [Ceratosolen solmsi marchali]
MSNSPNQSTQFVPINVLSRLKISPGKNLTGNVRIVRDLATDIHSSIQQWNVIHLNGIIILKNIANIKIDKTYPEELKGLCEDLGKICDESDKIVDNLKLLANKMKAISDLYKRTDNLFTTWPVKKFVSTSEKIYQVYQKEAIVKRIISEDMAHDYRDSWKILHLAAWVHQTQISDNVKTILESMLIETKLR